VCIRIYIHKLQRVYFYFSGGDAAPPPQPVVLESNAEYDNNSTLNLTVEKFILVDIMKTVGIDMGSSKW